MIPEHSYFEEWVYFILFLCKRLFSNVQSAQEYGGVNLP